MDEGIITWRMKCSNCDLDIPSIVASHFGFDRHGTLHIVGVCRFCLREMRLEHDAQEIIYDIDEAHNKWADEHGQEQIDIALWEQEFKDEN